MSLGLVRTAQQTLSPLRVLLPASFLAVSIAFAPPHSSSPVVRFTPIVKLDGFRLTQNWGGWSPRAPLLALEDEKGLYFVWDASRPQSPPIPLPVRGWIRKASWSPVGDRLLFVVKDAGRPDTIIVVRADGASVDTLEEDVDGWPIEWTPEADIVYRTRDGLQRLKPLSSWAVPSAIRQRKLPMLILGGDPAFSGLGLCRLEAASSRETPLSLLNPHLAGDHALLYDDVLETDRHLIHTTGRDPTVAVINGSGRVFADVGRLHMSSKSISRDGTLVAGEVAILEGGEGSLLADTVYVAGTPGPWCVPLSGAEEGGEPQLARTDSLIAFNALRGGVVIGRYEIRSR